MKESNYRHIFLLYFNFTNIKWDYTKSTIAGVLSRPQFQDVIDFDFDPEGKTDFEIANKLWNLMDGIEE